ncbi:MAG: hypothetical protein J1E83_02500 [Lachnospiraceae bacterium]|nr:hypothetical protein [Lachnospiraceae bacterium]
MEGFKPGEECAKCCGRCCKERGCSLAPEDMLRALAVRNKEIEITDTKLTNADTELRDTNKKSVLSDALFHMLQNDEHYAVDCISQSGRPFYYLRMRHKCYTFIGVEAMGECMALTPSGCSLSEEERPKGGRFLKSSPDGNCTQHYTKEEMLADWEPYQSLLSEIWEEFYGKFMEDGTFDACDEAYFAWMRQANIQNQS